MPSNLQRASTSTTSPQTKKTAQARSGSPTKFDSDPVIGANLDEAKPFYDVEHPKRLASVTERIRKLLRDELVPVHQGVDDAFDKTRDEYHHILGINVDLESERKGMLRYARMASDVLMLRESCKLVGLTEPETNLLVAAEVLRAMGIQGANPNAQVLPQLLKLLARLPESKEGS